MKFERLNPVICDDCGKRPAVGVLIIGKTRIPVCDECKRGVEGTTEPRTIVRTKKYGHRGYVGLVQPTNSHARSYKENGLTATWNELETYVKSQEGGLLKREALPAKFDKLLKSGKLYIPQTTNLSNVTVSSAGQYVVFDSKWKHGALPPINRTAFEQFISDRIGKDWYVMGSKNRPRTELEPILEEVRRHKEARDAVIETRPELKENIDIKLPDALEPLRMLVVDVVYRLNKSNVPVTYTYKDLMRFIGLRNFDDWTGLVALLQRHLELVSNQTWCGIKMRASATEHALTFERSKRWTK